MPKAEQIYREALEEIVELIEDKKLATQSDVMELLDHVFQVAAKSLNSAKSTEAQLDDVDPAVLIFPVKGGNSSWTLRRSKVAEYEETFPGIDIETECRKARQWCVDNPDRRKTPRGMNRFLFSWIERGNNNGRAAKKQNALQNNNSCNSIPAKPEDIPWEYDRDATN